MAMKMTATQYIGHGRYRRLLAFVSLLGLLPAYVSGAEPVLEIEISGVQGVLLENVRAHLSLTRFVKTGTGLPLIDKQETPALPDANRLRGLHRRATDEIRAALQPYGYYEPVIDSSLEKQGERWLARYQVDPGPPVIIQSVDIVIAGEGSGDAGIAKARTKNRLQTGERLQHPDYDATRVALLRAALGAGYLDARYTQSALRVTPTARSAEVILHLDTGPRYYFGKVEIEQDILDADFVDRLVPIGEGTPFDTAKLLDLQLALGDSGYFEQIELDVQRDAAPDRHVPVVVHTTPSPYVRYSAGVGFGTDTGPRISLGADYLRINRRGHGLTSDLRVSPVQQEAVVRYKIPIRNIISDRLVFGAYAENAEVADTGRYPALPAGRQPECQSRHLAAPSLPQFSARVLRARYRRGQCHFSHPGCDP